MLARLAAFSRQSLKMVAGSRLRFIVGAGESREARKIFVLAGKRIKGRMAKLADAIALGAIGATLGGSSPLPPIKFMRE